MSEKMAKNVSNETAFWFCTTSGSIGKIAHNLHEFAECLRTVPTESLEFHLRDDKNDFEAWLKKIMGETKLAKSFTRIKSKNLRGNELRKALEKIANEIVEST